MDDESKADATIRDHTGYAMLAALIPVPIAGLVAVTAVQLDLIKQLAGIYGTKYDETRAQALVAALTGLSAAHPDENATDAIPSFGTAPGDTSQLILSGAATCAIGRVLKSHLEDGGSLDDFDAVSARDRYEDVLEKAKDVVSAMKPTLPGVGGSSEEADWAVETLDRLARLRAAGTLDQEEFLDLKARVLDQWRGY